MQPSVLILTLSCRRSSSIGNLAPAVLPPVCFWRMDHGDIIMVFLSNLSTSFISLYRASNVSHPCQAFHIGNISCGPAPYWLQYAGFCTHRHVLGAAAGLLADAAPTADPHPAWRPALYLSILPGSSSVSLVPQIPVPPCQENPAQGASLLCPFLLPAVAASNSLLAHKTPYIASQAFLPQCTLHVPRRFRCMLFSLGNVFTGSTC